MKAWLFQLRSVFCAQSSKPSGQGSKRLKPVASRRLESRPEIFCTGNLTEAVKSKQLKQSHQGYQVITAAELFMKPIRHNIYKGRAVLGLLEDGQVVDASLGSG